METYRIDLEIETSRPVGDELIEWIGGTFDNADPSALSDDEDFEINVMVLAVRHITKD